MLNRLTTHSGIGDSGIASSDEFSVHEEVSDVDIREEPVILPSPLSVERECYLLTIYEASIVRLRRRIKRLAALWSVYADVSGSLAGVQHDRIAVDNAGHIGLRCGLWGLYRLFLVLVDVRQDTADQEG